MPRKALWVVVSFLSFVGPACPQVVDWARLFRDAVSPNQAVSDAARDRALNEIVPKLLGEKSELLETEIPGLVAALNDKDGKIRLQASGVLYGFSVLRPDSAVVLYSALRGLKEHVEDSEPRIQINSVNTLASLKPQIPTAELAFLIELTQNQNQYVAFAAFPASRE